MVEYKPEGYLYKTQKNKEYLSSEKGLKKAFDDGAILEAIAVSCDVEHNLIIDLNGIKAMIPRNEGAIGISEGETRDIALITKAGKPVCFKIISLNGTYGDFKGVILSRKIPQQQCFSAYIKKLTPGDIIPAKITHLDSFGCFADIGCGISALMPIDAISISRISHPKDRFCNNMDIMAVVRGKDDKDRILLSHKELLGSWEENAKQFMPGITVSGIVRSIEEYGVFVELAPNLAGLAEPKDNIKVGQKASVYIKSLIPEKMKIKLIIVDSFDDDDDFYQKGFKYYTNNESHIDRWVYSPDVCSKVIESVFESEDFAFV